MRIDNIDIDATLSEVERLLEEDKNISPALVSIITVLLLLVKLLTNRAGLNSSNSSKPPSTDNKKLKPTRKKSAKKSGDQLGHNGVTLKQIDEPDDIERIQIDRRTLPRGDYEKIGIERRQVFDIQICRWVTEFQAEVLIDKATGNRYVAQFPDDVGKAVQYGKQLKAHAVYMSQYQLIPYNRVQEFFADQMGIPIRSTISM